ncbi:hypothetical protein QVM55_26635 [Pseudomonas monteilii]|uniref:hypothetical protein n=1 Tax=Pseudomonas TaxID=286 RepID=UPI0011DC7F0A|nr:MULTISPECIES: hypothetical protein [Pseudomonas]
MKTAFWFSFMVVMAIAAVIAGGQKNVVGTFLAFFALAGSAFTFMLYFLEGRQSAKPHSKLPSAPEMNDANC